MLLVLALCMPWYAQAQVRHEVSFPDLNQQYIHIRSTFPVSAEEWILHVPAWIPGSYLVREFAADVDRPRFSDQNGNELSAVKLDKDSWQVRLGRATELTLEYRVHAGQELGVNTSWASPDYVLINGATLFMYSEQSRDMSQALSFELPDHFREVLCALAEHEGGFLAADFDVLIDGPCIVGSPQVHPFVEDDQPYRLVNVGETQFWDGPQSASDIRAIVDATNQFWRSMPFEEPYYFFNVLDDHGGGLEHDHGTVIMGHRWQMRDREDYIKWLSLAAHEYFHAWNVRRMRPAGIAKYDYQAEQYSGSLWLAEGFTSYYDNLLLSRAKLVSPAEYFKRLALDLHSLELTPGRQRISLREASRDAWIRHYRRDANSINSTVSYYTKGAVLAMILDAKLRRDSNDKRNLDQVMRAMWQRYRNQPYREQALERMIGELTDDETRIWLRRQIDGVDELNIDDALSWYGLVLDRHPVNTAATASGTPLDAGFGVNWDKSGGELRVANVIDGLAGARAGVLPGDELLAISGQRVTTETLDDLMARLEPGMTIDLLISRRNRILNVPVVTHESRSATYEILLKPEFGNRELKRLESWLGQPLAIQD